MSEQEKKRQRIYYLLITKTKPNFFSKNGVSLWSQSRPDLNPLDYAIRNQNKGNFPFKYWFA